MADFIPSTNMKDNMLRTTSLNEIKQYAILSKPEECCGLVLETLTGVKIWPTENCSEYDRTKTFKIHPFEVIKIEDQGKLIGIYHSHNSPSKERIFSELDIRNAQIHKIMSIVYNTVEEQFCFLTETSQLKYLGRKFLIGQNDCFSLIHDYFKNELKIELGNYPRDNKWFIKNPTIWLDNVEKGGCKIVFKGSALEEFALKKYDILLSDGPIEGVPCHGALYIGNGMVLHHPRNKLSTLEPLHQTLAERILFVIRHKHYGN